MKRDDIYTSIIHESRKIFVVTSSRSFTASVRIRENVWTIWADGLRGQEGGDLFQGEARGRVRDYDFISDFSSSRVRIIGIFRHL